MCCIADLQHWMDTNFLKLNDDKTEAIFFGSIFFGSIFFGSIFFGSIFFGSIFFSSIFFGSSHQLKKVSVECIPVGDTSFIPSIGVKNLGIMQDSSMTMVAHISCVCAPPPTSTFGTVAAFVPSSHRQPLNSWYMPLLHPDSTWTMLSFGVMQAQLSRLQRV